MSKTKPTQLLTPPAETDLPEGWVPARLPDVADIIMGQSPPGSTYNEDGDGLPFFQGKAEFGERHPTVRKWCSAPNKIAAAGDILISIRAPVGPTNVADRTCAIGRGLAAIRPLGGVPTDFLLHSLRLQENELASQGTGSTFTAINRGHLDAFELRVPPLPEQKRIVAKVETLLQRVNAARARLAWLPTILKRFRQSVLAAACSGQLTAERRVQRGTAHPPNDTELPAAWERLPLRDLCEGFEYGSSRKSADEGSTPVLRMGNLQDGKIDWSKLKYSSDPAEIAKYSLAPNTVLFNRTNSPKLVGKTAIYRGERPAIFAGYLIRIIHGPRLNAEFLNYCLNTHDFREYCMQVKTDGVSQSNINAKKLARYEVPVPPLEEQREIVRRVEALFALADGVEANVRAATVRAERLPQAILTRAFSGELVPTEAELAAHEGREYEPASVLLERIQETRKQHRPAPGKRGHGGKKMARRSTGRQAATKRRALDEVLREQGKPLTPEQLFDLAGFDEGSVDGFFEQLRKLIQDGKVREDRPNKKDVTLEAVGT